MYSLFKSWPFSYVLYFFKESLIYINKRLKYDNDFKLPQGTKIEDLIIAIKTKIIAILSEDEDYIHQLSPGQSFDGNKINYYFWNEYYINNRDMLNEYIKPNTTKDIDYMTQLFDKVIDSLPKYEKYDK